MTKECNIKIQLPDNVKNIINTITEAGYEAYAVGGCIRDKLLNKEPEDYDITTSATPEEIKGLFRRTVDTGIKHGTVTIMIGQEGYEVTTYRIDGKYEDSRHPKEVLFTRSLKEDLLRRDFTINAMAYNDTSGLVDLFGGQDDLKNRIIRCVGDPASRLSEDALRIMRAVRFSAQLDYDIEEDTLKAMSLLADNLKNISEERIQIELIKLLISNHPERIRTAYELGLTKVFLKEFDAVMECDQNNPHHCYSVGEHTIHAIQNIEPDKYLRLAMLFHDFGKPSCKTTDEEGINHFHGHPIVSSKMAKDILRRLKFDNQTIDIVSGLAKYHDVEVELTKKAVRRAVNKIGEELFPLVLKVKKADVLAQSDFKREEKLNKIAELEKIYKEIIDNGDCLSLRALEIDGKDLIKIGYPSSKVLGQELLKLLEMVLNDPTLNEKETLLKLAMEDINDEKES